MFPRLILNSLCNLGDLELLIDRLGVTGVWHHAQIMLCWELN